METSKKCIFMVETSNLIERLSSLIECHNRIEVCDMIVVKSGIVKRWLLKV